MGWAVLCVNYFCPIWAGNLTLEMLRVSVKHTYVKRSAS
jgi:hypothetical protein